MDGQTVVASESSAGQDVFQQVLGTVSGLSNEKHTAVVTSSSASSIDIDYVNVQTQIGETGCVFYFIAMSTLNLIFIL